VGPATLVYVEVEDVGDLEVFPVHQYEIAADEDVHVARRRRRKHDFQFMRTRLHPGAKFDGYDPLSDEEALLPGREAIVPGEAGRQMAVVRMIPVANVAVVVAVCLPPFVSIGVPVIVVALMVIITVVPVFVVPIMPVVIVILRKSQGCGECQRNNRERTGAEKELQ